MTQQMSGSYEITEIDTHRGSVDLSNTTAPSLTVRGIRFFPGDVLYFRDDRLDMARIKGPHEIGGNVLRPGSQHIDVTFGENACIRQISFSEPLEANGLVFQPSYLFFYTTGQLYSGALQQSAEIYGIPLDAGKGDMIFLYPNGRLKFGVLAKPLCIDGFNLQADRVILFSDGKLDTATLAGEHTIATKFDGNLKCKGSLSLHENGLPHVVELAANFAGRAGGNRTHFDEAGHITGSPPMRCEMRFQIGRGIVTDALQWPHCELSASADKQ
jgi:hypothetical protein